MAAQNSFKVGFESEQGLDEIVDLAVSDAKGELVLFANVMPQPVSWLKVLLRPNEALEGGRPGYVLTAELLPSGEGVLKVNPSDYQNCFGVAKLQPVGSRARYSLTHPDLVGPYSSLEVFEGFGNRNRLAVWSSMVCQKWYDAPKGRWASEEEIKGQARHAIQAFATALETTVNSAYKCAGKPMPEQTLVLAAPA